MAFSARIVPIVSLVAACAKPPPCELRSPARAWTAPAESCTKPAGWAGGEASLQLDAEWLLYDGEAVFDGLPASARDANLAAFTAARDQFIAADHAFVAAIGANPHDVKAAHATLVAAVDAFVLVVAAWSLQTSARNSYVDARTRADSITRHARG